MPKYLLATIKQGFGNKIFLLAKIIKFYNELNKFCIKNDKEQFSKIIIMFEISRHGETLDDFLNFFPNLKDHPSFIFTDNWSNFDKIRKEHEIGGNLRTSMKINVIDEKEFKTADKHNSGKSVFLDTTYYFPDVCISYNETDIINIYEILSINPEEIELKREYNFDNDIFIHIRMGDKVDINKGFRKSPVKYIILNPDYYINNVKGLRVDNPDSKVYIFTDYPDFVNKEIIPYIDNSEIVDESLYNVWYLAQNFKYLILSDSTLTHSSLPFNENEDKIIFSFGYTVSPIQRQSWPISNKTNDIIEYKGIKLENIEFYLQNGIQNSYCNLITNLDYLII